MNWDAVGASAEIIGAIAVIASLIYLARQIGQSVKLTRATYNRAIAQAYENLDDLILSNPEVRSALAAMTHPTDEPISLEEAILQRHAVRRIGRTLASAQLGHSLGQLGSYELAVYRKDFEEMLQFYPGMRPHIMDLASKLPGWKTTPMFEWLFHDQ